MNDLAELDNEELLATYATQVHEVNTPSPDLDPEDEKMLKEEAFEDLKAIQQEVLRRMTASEETHCRMGVRCPKHDNQIHGQEASELRTEIEKFLLECVDDISVHRDLQAILDRVDCRDSFAYEQKNDRQARQEQAEKLSLSVEGLDLLFALRVLEDYNHPTTEQLRDKGLIDTMFNPDGVLLSLLGVQMLEKLDAEDAEPKSRFQSAAFLATDVETEGVGEAR